MFKDKPLSTHGVQGPSPKTELGTVDESTLPNEHINAPHMRSVMWHGPNPTGLGSRSEVPQAAVARGVTGGVRTPTGTSLAAAALSPSAYAEGRYTSVPIVTVTRSDGDENESQLITPSETITNWDDFLERLRWTPCPVYVSDTVETVPLKSDVIEQCQAIIRLARAMVELKNLDRRKRKDTTPKQETLDDYRKKGAQIDSEILRLPDGTSNPLMLVMGRHAIKVQSFTAIKSALKWRAMTEVEMRLRRQDDTQRKSGLNHGWLQIVRDLYSAIADFIVVNDLDRGECLAEAFLTAKRGRSKRSDLPLLPDGWQERFYDITAHSQKFGDACVLLLHCGLRPIELAMGVVVFPVPEGVAVRIKGGKVRETAGQPWRSFVLDPQALPSSFVQRVHQQRELIVSAEPDALRAYLNRLSDQVFLQGEYRPEGKHRTDYVLSAYNFRHALVTQLREDKWTTEAIASVIGETAAETVRYYGIRSRQGVRPGRKVAVISGSQATARPVRAMDMQGLSRVLNTREETSKKRPSM